MHQTSVDMAVRSCTRQYPDTPLTHVRCEEFAAWDNLFTEVADVLGPGIWALKVGTNTVFLNGPYLSLCQPLT
jgi:hypothetical protein